MWEWYSGSFLKIQLNRIFLTFQHISKSSKNGEFWTKNNPLFSIQGHFNLKDVLWTFKDICIRFSKFLKGFWKDNWAPWFVSKCSFVTFIGFDVAWRLWCVWAKRAQRILPCYETDGSNLGIEFTFRNYNLSPRRRQIFLTF